jgi:hypothetical protein
MTRILLAFSNWSPGYLLLLAWALLALHQNHAFVSRIPREVGDMRTPSRVSRRRQGTWKYAPLPAATAGITSGKEFHPCCVSYCVRLENRTRKPKCLPGLVVVKL